MQTIKCTERSMEEGIIVEVGCKVGCINLTKLWDLSVG